MKLPRLLISFVSTPSPPSPISNFRLHPLRMERADCTVSASGLTLRHRKMARFVSPVASCWLQSRHHQLSSVSVHNVCIYIQSHQGSDEVLDYVRTPMPIARGSRGACHSTRDNCSACQQKSRHTRARTHACARTHTGKSVTIWAEIKIVNSENDLKRKSRWDITGIECPFNKKEKRLRKEIFISIFSVPL